MYDLLLYLVTVEHQHLAPEQAAQGFDRLGLAGAGGPVGVPSQPHLHGLGESQVALISQRRVHQLGRVTLEAGGDRTEKKVSDKAREAQNRHVARRARRKLNICGSEGGADEGRRGRERAEPAEDKGKQTDDGLGEGGMKKQMKDRQRK